MRSKMMEASLYNDDSFASREREKMNKLKKSMKLEFNGTSAGASPLSPPAKKLRGMNCVSVLSSPDLHMLQLASPELEKLIILSHGLVATTPTPTLAPIVFPRNVTEEQEQYVRGFVDALNELYTTNKSGVVSATNAINFNGTNNGNRSIVINSVDDHHQQQQVQIVTLESASNVVSTVDHHTMAVVAAGPPITTTSSSSSSGSFASRGGPTPPKVTNKDDSQTVPSFNETLSLCPIDMVALERVKLERKRERNRIAASRCRRRKLDRIADLEDKVKLLKDDNVELSNVALRLKESVTQLKNQILEHASHGCKIITDSESLMKAHLLSDKR